MENIQAVIEQKTGEIHFNFMEMKEFLDNKLEEYRTAVFTDDSVKLAKGHVAQLRKEQAEFRTRITDVKKMYMQPFDRFKAQADELIRLYDEPINFIDGQVKRFDGMRREEKRKLIASIYAELAGDVAEYIPLQKIYNHKWENATFREKEIRKEISGVADSTRKAVGTIKAMDSDAVDRALAIYRQGLSLPDAVTYINDYERKKAEILLVEQEKRRQEEAERIRTEERRKVEEERLAAEKMEKMLRAAQAEKEEAVNCAAESGRQEIIEELTPELTGNTELFEYRVALNEDAKKKLEMYMDSVGIEWELI